MAIIPIPKVEQLEFCESHSPVWLTQFAAIGVSSAQAESFKAVTLAARAAFDAAQAAKQAYHAAVTAQNAALAEATSNAADLIRVIKGFAELAPSPNAVYALAELPTPATPVPAQAPGKPEGIAVMLEPTGAITITWSATDSAAGSGGFFDISRKLPGQSSFTSIGTAPGSTTERRRMTFTDLGLPTSAAGGGGAQYIIQGRRGHRAGEMSEAVVVQFGVEGEGVGVGGSAGQLKMAA